MLSLHCDSDRTSVRHTQNCERERHTQNWQRLLKVTNEFNPQVPDGHYDNEE